MKTLSLIALYTFFNWGVNIIVGFDYINQKKKIIYSSKSEILDQRKVIDSLALIKYYYYANKAEIKAIESDFNTACTYYDSCFALPINHFSQEMYNASICELTRGNFEKTVHYCLRLVERGATAYFFENRYAYKGLRANNKHWAVFKNNYAAHRKYYLTHTDTTLIALIKNMHEVDQKFYRERPKHLNDNIFLDSLARNDKFLSNILTAIFQERGYLDESIIGANIIDTTLSIYPIFDILIRHHYQLKQYDFTNFLKQAVAEGKLKPDIFCSWYNFEKKPIGYGDELYIIKYKCNFYEANYKWIKDEIEKNRKKMWLPTLDDLKKKILYRYSIDLNKYIFYAPLAILPPMDEHSEESFKFFNSLLPDKPTECK